MATVSRGTELDRLQRVLETQRVVNAGPPDAGRIIALVLERVQAALDADGAAIEFVEGDELVRQATSGLSRSTNSRTERVDASLSGQCVRRVMPLLCRDTRTDFRVDEDGYREAGIRSVAVAPIVRAGESVGVLEVLSARSDHFDHGDADVVELMANFVAPLHQGTSTLGLEAERALRDPLTGLANRLIFTDRLANQLSQSRRYGSPFGLFFVDLDDFSLINDSLGRDWGDAVLCAIAEGLSRDRTRRRHPGSIGRGPVRHLVHQRRALRRRTSRPRADRSGHRSRQPGAADGCVRTAGHPGRGVEHGRGHSARNVCSPTRASRCPAPRDARSGIPTHSEPLAPFDERFT